jgi:hypothetical protein
VCCPCHWSRTPPNFPLTVWCCTEPTPTTAHAMVMAFRSRRSSPPLPFYSLHVFLLCRGACATPGASHCSLVQAHPPESRRRRRVQSRRRHESIPSPSVSSTLQSPLTSMRPSLTSSFIPGSTGTLTYRRRSPECHRRRRPPPLATVSASSWMTDHSGELHRLYGYPTGSPFLGGAHPGDLTVREPPASPLWSRHCEHQVGADCTLAGLV